MKKFEDLTYSEIEKLAVTGLLWEIYPEQKPKFDFNKIFGKTDKEHYIEIEKKHEHGDSEESTWDYYPKHDSISNPFEKPRYFIEYYKTSKELNYKICQRVFIIDEDEYNRRLEESDEFDTTLWVGVEGHPYTLHAGVVNETRNFLEFTIDALNEKVQNDNISTISARWLPTIPAVKG
jgi:hypothetical protein